MAAAPRRKGFVADWRSVRVWEHETSQHLRRHNSLLLHGWCIGIAVMVAMWAVAFLQMKMLGNSLALRYALTLGVGYLVFLALLRVWAGWLAGEARELEIDAGDVADGADLALDVAGEVAPRLGRMADAVARSGREVRLPAGGDGSGASGDFSAASDAGSAIGDLAGGALGAAGDADEGALVVVPVVAVFLIVSAVVLGAGSLLLLFFGSEVLLAVAVELAFSYVSARTAVRMAREGWLLAAVRLTWKPLAGALACAVLLGGLVDYFIPAAQSLPEAIRLMRR